MVSSEPIPSRSKGLTVQFAFVETCNCQTHILNDEKKIVGSMLVGTKMGFPYILFRPVCIKTLISTLLHVFSLSLPSFLSVFFFLPLFESEVHLDTSLKQHDK